MSAEQYVNAGRRERTQLCAGLGGRGPCCPCHLASEWPGAFTVSELVSPLWSTPARRGGWARGPKPSVGRGEEEAQGRGDRVAQQGAGSQQEGHAQVQAPTQGSSPPCPAATEPVSLSPPAPATHACVHSVVSDSLCNRPSGSQSGL